MTFAAPEADRPSPEASEAREPKSTGRRVEAFDVAPPEFNRVVERLSAEAKQSMVEHEWVKKTQNFSEDVVRSKEEEARAVIKQLGERMQEGVERGFVLPVDLTEKPRGAASEAQSGRTVDLPELARFQKEPSATNYRFLERKLTALGFERMPITLKQTDYFVRTEHRQPTK